MIGISVFEWMHSENERGAVIIGAYLFWFSFQIRDSIDAIRVGSIVCNYFFQFLFFLFKIGCM